MEFVNMFSEDDVRKIFDLLRDCVEYYDKNFYYSETRIIFLANGESFKFEIPRYNIPHMLGVDTNYLRSTGNYTSTDSYSILKEFLQKGSHNFYSKCASGYMNISSVFSEHLSQKIKVFRKNLSLNMFDSQLVCKIARDRGYFLGKDYEDANTIIVQECDLGYCVLEVKTEKGKAYAISSRLYETEEEFLDFCNEKMTGQNLTYITCMKRILDYEGSKFYNLFNPEKIKRLNLLKQYAKTLDATIDVSGDYSFCLEKYGDEYERSKNIEATNEQILYDKNKALESELLRVKSELASLRESYNDLISLRDSLMSQNEDYLECLESINQLTRKRINKSVD